MLSWLAGGVLPARPGTLALMKASEGQHPRRKVQRFLEHRVLARTEVGVEVPLPRNWQYLPARCSCRVVLEQAHSLGLLVKDARGGQIGDARCRGLIGPANMLYRPMLLDNG